MTAKVALVLSVATVLFVSACVPIQEPTAVPVVDAPTATAAVSEIPADAPRIDLESAKQHYDAGTAIFVDARSEEDYQAAHIAGAIRLANEPATFADALPKDAMIITYCT